MRSGHRLRESDYAIVRPPLLDDGEEIALRQIRSGDNGVGSFLPHFEDGTALSFGSRKVSVSPICTPTVSPSAAGVSDRSVFALATLERKSTSGAEPAHPCCSTQRMSSAIDAITSSAM